VGEGVPCWRKRREAGREEASVKILDGEKTRGEGEGPAQGAGYTSAGDGG